MTTTHHDTAPAWRDLADQLTPAQFERLVQVESTSKSGPAETAETLLGWARDTAQANRDDRLHFGHLGQPEGATQVYACGQRCDGMWMREFVGRRWVVGTVDVTIVGTQFADGQVERLITVDSDTDAEVDGPGGLQRPEDARAVAAALVEAADELDRLAL